MNRFDDACNKLSLKSKELGLSKTLKVFIDEELLSKQDEHRIKIRQRLKKSLMDFAGRIDMSDQELQDEISRMKIDDLSGFPLGGEFFDVSISHCQLAGGFAITEKQGVGFDIEEQSRVRKKAILRVSNQEALEAAPGASELWAGLEASYKAMKGGSQPESLLRLSISGWQEIGDELYAYSFFTCPENPTLSGQGLVLRACELVVAISFLRG